MMKFLLLTSLFFILMCSSCTPVCDKTLTGTVVDALSNEAIEDLPVKISAIKNGSWGDVSIAQEFSVKTDELGAFEIHTDTDFTSWGIIRIYEGEYNMMEEQFSFQDIEVCGENHINITAHPLSTVILNLFDDPEKSITRTNITTEFIINDFFFWEISLEDESVTIPVLAEIPNEIILWHLDNSIGSFYSDTLHVEIPLGDTLMVDVGL